MRHYGIDLICQCCAFDTRARYVDSPSTTGTFTVVYRDDNGVEREPPIEAIWRQWHASLFLLLARFRGNGQA